MSGTWFDSRTDTENAGHAVKNLGSALVELGEPNRDFKATLVYVREARNHIQAWQARHGDPGPEPGRAGDLNLTLADMIHDAITWVVRADEGRWKHSNRVNHYSVPDCLVRADALLESVTLWLLAQSRPARWKCKECSSIGTFKPGLEGFWRHYRDAHDPKAGLVQSMLRVGGKPFRCQCGANVLTHDLLDDTYACNGCATVYQGEK